MLTRDRFVSKYRNVLDQRASLRGIMASLDELVKCQSKVFAGSPLRERHAVWQILRVQGLEIDNASITVNILEGDLLVFLVALADDLRRAFVSIKICNLSHDDKFRLFQYFGSVPINTRSDQSTLSTSSSESPKSKSQLFTRPPPFVFSFFAPLFVYSRIG